MSGPPHRTPRTPPGGSRPRVRLGGDPFTAGVTHGTGARYGPTSTLGTKLFVAATALYIAIPAYFIAAGTHPAAIAAPPPFQMYVTPHPTPTAPELTATEPHLRHARTPYCAYDHLHRQIIELYRDPHGQLWLFLNFAHTF